MNHLLKIFTRSLYTVLQNSTIRSQNDGKEARLQATI
jgi:hypothetical protein